MNEKTRMIIKKFILNPTLKEMKNINSNVYGVTQEYNKENRDKLWDSASGKKEFKEFAFQGRKIYDDPISGNKLHSTQKSAQNKYHMKNKCGENVSTAWANYSPDTDHIVSLKEVHERVKVNPFLSDADIKEIANSTPNYRITSKSFNASKGERSDFEFVFNKDNGISVEGRAKLLKEKIGAEATLATKFTARTAKNVGTEFTEGALFSLQASAIPLVVEGVNNLYKIANGDKEFGEAVEDMGKLTLSVASTGGTIKVISTGTVNIIGNSGKKGLQRLANSSEVMNIITISLIMKDSVIRYINGEIDGRGFFEEIGEKGVGIFTGTIGAIAGEALLPVPVVGAAIGSIIVSMVCMDIYGAYKSVDKFKKVESEVSLLASEALEEMIRQQEFLKELIQEEFTEWDKCFKKGYEVMRDGILNSSVDRFSEGLNQLLRVFGRDVAFKDQESFDEMFFNDNSVFNM